MQFSAKTTACYALTGRGAHLARRIAAALDGDLFVSERLNVEGAHGFDRLPALVAETFRRYRSHIFVCAAGVVLRCIAPLIGSKRDDPAVLVCDAHGRHVISLLSGHLGGANALAARVAEITGGEAVITTASDAEALPAFDLLARAAGCAAVDAAEFAPVQAALLEGEPVHLYDPHGFFPSLADLCPPCADPASIPPGQAHALADWRAHVPAPKRLRLAAPLIHIGVGCRKDTPAEEILAAVHAALEEAGAEASTLAGFASARLKEQESGLLEAAKTLGFTPRFFGADALAAVPVPHPSAKAGEILGQGPIGVCEGAALLSAGPGSTLLLPKRAQGRVTVALALPAQNASPPERLCGPAPLRVVGIGPGDASNMTAQAVEAVAASRVVAGYGLYLDLLPPELLAGKRRLSTGMRREADRCNAAIDAALEGLPTAMVCSGDAGVYGMAGLILELLEQRGLLDRVPLEVVPGVPALCAAAALLGAPLMHDFACISLSDLLTPLELIMRRVEAALKADFVLVLYNPRSKGRPAHLGTVLEIAREARAAGTPVGLVRNACRQGQEVSLHSLEDFDPERADMLSIVFIGNSATRRAGNRLITPRGYRLSRPAASGAGAD